MQQKLKHGMFYEINKYSTFENAFGFRCKINYNAI